MQLGFPLECSDCPSPIIYMCHPTDGTRAVVWKQASDGNLRVNLYSFPPLQSDAHTSWKDRALAHQQPLSLGPDAGPLEIQLAINYLVQLFQELPTEVMEHAEA